MSTANQEPAVDRTSLPARPRVQASLKVGAFDDPLEREADAIAERVMRMPDPMPALAGGRPGDEKVRRCPAGCPREGCGHDLAHRPLPTAGSAATVHRQPANVDEPEEPYPFPSEPLGLGVAPVEEEEGSEALRRSVPNADQGRAAPTAVSLPRSPEQRLPAAVRAWMEPRFGTDFGAARVHTDASAGRAARDLHAEAFTVGRDIYFAPDSYRPDSSAGRRLLAHELAHVLQSTSVLRRSIASAFANYRGSCDCGEDLGNNCAHYLSDACIRSGYDGELDGGTGARYRRRNGRIVCRAGRPVRAKEFRDWFASRASTRQEGEPSGSGHWAVYQERRSDGQGHVNIHAHSDDTYDWRGTTDLPTWRTQTHYSW